MPSVTRQPVSQSVLVGETASFSVTIAGTPASQLQWQKRSFVAAAFGFVAWTNIDGATGATYTTPPVALADTATQYRAWATNAVGNVASDIAMLTVVERFLPPVIVAQPGNLNVVVGGTAVFAATVSGPGPLSYQWRRNGVNLTGANSAILTISNVTALNDGRYDLLVTNSAGSVTTEPGLLQVTLGTPVPLAPAIAAPPASIAVAEGNAANFAVAVTGTGPYMYQWFKAGVTAPIANSDFPSFSIASVTAADAGAYSVRVSNNVGQVLSAAATLTVSPGTGVTVAPTITTAPVSLAVLPGGGATFAVAAAGTAPFTYQWRRNGADIAGATAAVLHIAAVTALDAGQYAIEVRNATGLASSTAVPLIVIGAPVITLQPAAAAATEGSAATFSVAANGDSLRYQWTRNQIAIAGATSASYTTPALTLADSGAVYGVIVYNGAGLVFSQSAVLTVSAAPTLPTFATQPSNQSVTAGTSASFTVAVNGLPTPTLQWQRSNDGGVTWADVVGATSATYTTAATAVGDNGAQLRALARNDAGAVPSTAAVLVVTPAPAAQLALVANSNANTLSIFRADAGTGALSAIGTTGAGAYPYAVAITPNGLFAYVTNLVGNNVSSYSIDANAGTVTMVGSSVSSVNPYGIAMDPLGRFVWAVNYSASTVSAYTINGTTGQLAAAGAPVATGTYPYAVAVHPSGNYAYVANEMGNSVSAYSVNSSTGQLTLLAGTIANSAFRPHGIAVDPSGRFVYAVESGGSGVAAFRINASTGVLTVVGYASTGSSPSSVVVHPNGQFVYVANQGSSSVSVFAINGSTGALTAVGSPIATGSSPTALAVNAAGSYLYVANSGGNSSSAFSINASTGALTSLGANVPTGSGPNGIATTP